MKLAPVRFANVIKLENPSKQDVDRQLNHSQAYEGNVYFMPEHATEPLGHVVILTGEDASVAQSLVAGMHVFEKELLAKDHGAQKGLHLRLMRQFYHLTEANTLGKLSLWYHNAPGKEIVEVHQRLMRWMIRNQDRHENALSRQGQILIQFQAFVETHFKDAKSIKPPSQPKKAFMIKGSPVRH